MRRLHSANNENIRKKEEENEHAEENEINKEDTVNNFEELQNGQNSDGDNLNENAHGKFDKRHILEDSSCFS